MVDKIGEERDLIAAAGSDKDLVRAKTAAIIMAEKTEHRDKRLKEKKNGKEKK